MPDLNHRGDPQGCLCMSYSLVVQRYWCHEQKNLCRLPSYGPLLCTKHVGNISEGWEPTPTGSQSIHPLPHTNNRPPSPSVQNRNKLPLHPENPALQGTHPPTQLSVSNLVCVDSPGDLPWPVRWPVLIFYPREQWLSALLHSRFVLGWHLSVTNGLRTSNNLGKERAFPSLCFVRKHYDSKITVIWAVRKCESSFQIYNCKALDKRQVTNPWLK